MVDLESEAIVTDTRLGEPRDAIDPAYAPALGTPEPYGLTPRDVRAVISCLAPDIVGFDLVEIAPAYDSGGTAILGAKLVRDFIAANAKASK